MLSLETPVQTLRMIGPAYGYRLKRLGIETIADLLYHIPFRYEDFSTVSKIGLLIPNTPVTILGVIKEIKNIYTKTGKKIQKAKLIDETGEIEVIWYNQTYLISALPPGTKASLAGEAKFFGNKLTLVSPDFEIIRPGTDPIHGARLVPIYPETEGLSSKWLRSRIDTILNKLNPQIEEFLPEEILRRFDLVGQKEAVYNAHFPKTLEVADRAKKRLAFDELLVLELAAIKKRASWKKNKVLQKIQFSPWKKKFDSFIKSLPFRLTSAQKRSINEIVTDLTADVPMNRLLEGDVGSGKTVVATSAIYLTKLNNLKSVMLAPTEILAQQHFMTIDNLLTPQGVKVGFISGTKAVKNTSSYDVIVGTHALISPSRSYKNLALVIIDEQQRFGVEQRARLREKGANPHLLTMTATPIPRTIALTLYADLDLSTIDEMPQGRKLIKTWVVPTHKREAAYNWIKQQILNSNTRQQAFIICPFIDESETLTSVRAATSEFKKLKTHYFTDLSLGLLHGKLPVKEKDEILTDFKVGELDILVSTPIVEVGIDIATASIMMIEGAERFGLAQLHQLRGRVGRGNQQSFCLLFTESSNEKIIQRLKTLEVTYDGAKLAEIDLKLRGAGDIFGTLQHGRFGLKFASLSDLNLINESKKAARILLSKYKLSQFPYLQRNLLKYTINKVAPD